MPAEGNGNLQTLICVLVARPRRCLTLSNPVDPLTKLNGGLSRLHSADQDSFFMADQLWFMTRIREEEEAVSKCANTCPPIYTYESANIQFQIFVTVYSEITENMCIIIQLVIGTPQPRQQ